MLLPLAVGAGLGLATVAPFLVRRLGPRAFAWLALYPVGVFALLARAQASEWSVPWVPQLGIELAFRLDGLSKLFALLISGLGALILVYASGYFKPKPNLGRFAGAFLGFMAAMLGLVLSDDAIGLFVFWELTSVTSYLLIGFYHEDKKSRLSAQQALLLTGAGGLAMMAGLLLLGSRAGSFRLSDWPAFQPGDPLVTAAFWLVLAGCATKSAQFPFHFWLPNAMAAPSPVSAFLHSATMVKAGVFLLARLEPNLVRLPEWTPALSTLGGATVLVSSLLLLWNRDIKKLLAYTTVGTLGGLVFLLATPGPIAGKAFVALVVGHALYKGALFLLAGSLDHATGTRDTFELGGLRRAMPWSSGSAFLVAASALGFVGFAGFIAKEYFILSSTVWWSWIVVGAFAVAGSAVAFRVAVLPFLGSARFSQAHEVPLAMRVGPLVLGVAGLAVGAGVGVVGPWLLTPAIQSIDPSTGAVKWIAFPGFNAAFFAGLALSGAGVLVGWKFRAIQGEGWPSLDAVWHAGVAGLPSASARVSRVVQTGKLRHYFRIYFGIVALAGGYCLWRWPGWGPAGAYAAPLPHELAIVVLAVLTTGAVLVSRSRIAAICMLGIVGTGVAVVFLAFGAVDLAITQLLTELMTIVIAVLVFHRLPRFRRFAGVWSRLRDGAIALAFGMTMTMLVLTVDRIPHDQHVADYYAATAVEKAQGRNVVNTILVDYRALDTLGEVAVVLMAAIGVFALMRLRPHQEGES